MILAGISISMLAGDNSILQKTTTAKQTSERAEAKEQAQMDIMAYITDKTANHQDASIDDEKVKDILTGKSYVKTANATSFITTKGEYVIPYSELYTAAETTPTTSYGLSSDGTYFVGQLSYSGFVSGNEGDLDNTQLGNESYEGGCKFTTGHFMYVENFECDNRETWTKTNQCNVYLCWDETVEPQISNIGDMWQAYKCDIFDANSGEWIGYGEFK